MDLLLVANDFPNSNEPTKGVFNLHLARGLARKHVVRVIAPIPWVDEFTAALKGGAAPLARRRESEEGVEVHHPRYYYTPRSFRNFYGHFYYHSIKHVARELLAARAPDAVVGYWAHPDGEVAVRLARQVGVPSAVIIGGSDVLLLTRDPRRRAKVLGVLKAADVVVVVSRDLREKVLELGVDPGKVFVWMQGVDEGRFFRGDKAESRRRLGIPESERALVWVGRMVPVKGLDLLLASCSELAGRGVDFHLYLVGDGPLRGELEANARARGLSGSVTFVGIQSHDALPDWYSAADLTVLPSRSEGLPNVLRESLACGTRFVASRVGGIPEIAGMGAGRLADPADPSSFAEEVARALEEGGTLGELPRQATWTESADALVRLLEPHLGPRPGARRGPVGGPDEPRRFSPRQLVRGILSASLPRRTLLTRGRPGSGGICLTFDDGPHPEHTPRLLDVLKAQDIKATFFVVGEHAERHPEIVRRIVGEGHAIGHHSYSHPGPGCATARQLRDEARRTRSLLAELVGEPSNLFRPPYGKLNARECLALWRDGQTIVLWSVDPRDYLRGSVDDLRDWLRGSMLRSGDIVLLHDKCSHTADFIPDLADRVRGHHLTFETVPQVM